MESSQPKMTPKQFSQKGFKEKAWLYSFIFLGRWSLLVTLFLVSSFLIQPINQALAEEEVSPVAEDVTPQEEEREDGADIADLNEDEPELEEEEDVAPEDVLDLTGSSDDSVDTADELEEANDETEEEMTSEIGTETASTTEDIREADNTDEEEVSETPILIDEEASEEVLTLDEIQQELEAELSGEVAESVDVIVSDDNFFQFDRQSCVATGNGAYHCTVDDAPSLDESTVVYADRGANGSMQVFLRTANGGVRQITNDPYDNGSPHFNAESREVVWQRLIEGRYQIILYDIDEAEERQLTFSRTNNMEPKVSVDGIVWQAWDGNDWEIMYFDGTYTDQITDNIIQDVAPAIEDKYILWSVLGTETSEAKVYSLDSQETLTITGQEGGTIANPRFVLVYDTRFENGDIVTQGFDPVTGESSPLGATPAPDPIDIPDVDPLGEVRALINNKAQTEDEFDQLLVPDNASSSNTLNLTDSATSTDSTLDLSTTTDDGTPDVDLSSTSTSTDEFELTDFDLVIPTTDLNSLDESIDTQTSTTSNKNDAVSITLQSEDVSKNSEE